MACRHWVVRHPTGRCRSCHRVVPLVGHFCRLCLIQAGIDHHTHIRETDVLHANRHGQQLWFADLPGVGKHKQAKATSRPEPVEPRKPRAAPQLTLFWLPHQLAAAGRAGLHTRADPDESAPLERLAEDLAATLGWHNRLLRDTRIGIRIMIGVLDEDDLLVNDSQVEQLRHIDLPVWSVRQVLSQAGRLRLDRTPTLDRKVAESIRHLPEPMRTEVAAWFDVMKNGTNTPPRRRPRSSGTIDLHFRWALPVLTAWAANGHTSLRDITREDVLNALPPSGNPRSTTGQGLKSVFRVLKAQKVVFINPTSRVKTGQHQSGIPVPLDPAPIRAALNSANPAQALLVALIAFHGLDVTPLQRLHLTDHRDGKLHVNGRVIVLAEPVQERLDNYLAHRAHTWPATSNPHLLVNRRSAGRLRAVGRRWIYLTIGTGLSPTALREDRILNEAHATSGDIRRLIDLFGLSAHASARYAATLDNPDLITAGSRTHDHP